MYGPLLSEMSSSESRCAFLISSERTYAIQSFGKNLLCVCDYLSMAVSSVPKEKVEGDAADMVISCASLCER